MTSPSSDDTWSVLAALAQEMSERMDAALAALVEELMVDTASPDRTYPDPATYRPIQTVWEL